MSAVDINIQGTISCHLTKSFINLLGLGIASITESRITILSFSISSSILGRPFDKLESSKIKFSGITFLNSFLSPTKYNDVLGGILLIIF